MNELEKVYRDAPKVESPAGLDKRVLRAAESRSGSPASGNQVESVRLRSGWQIAAFAVSGICVFGIGLGVMLETGLIDTRNSDQPAGNSSSVASVELERNGASSGVEAAGPPVDTKQLALRTQPQVEQGSNYTGDEVQMDEVEQLADAGSVSSAVAMEPMPAADLTADSDAAGDVSAAVTSKVNTQPGVEASVESELAEPQSFQESGGSSAATSQVQQKSGPATPSRGRAVSNFAAAPEPAAKSGKNRATRTRSPEWLSMQTQNDYTVLLTPARDSASLVLIADNIPVVTDQLRANSESWLLLHGQFANRAMAQLALAKIIKSVAELPQVKVLVEPRIVSFREVRQLVE